MAQWRWLLGLLMVLPVVACMAPPERSVPVAVQAPAKPGFQQFGKASWYGPWHHGRTTASGEPFDQNDFTAAHRTLPMNTRIKVTNVENGRSVVVTVNDRGPYKAGRVLDLSKRAAEELGMKEQGLADVRIETIEETGVASSD